MTNTFRVIAINGKTLHSRFSIFAAITNQKKRKNLLKRGITKEVISQIKILHSRFFTITRKDYKELMYAEQRTLPQFLIRNFI